MAKIPRLFHSVEHGDAFTNCISCQRDLLHYEGFYSITKAYQGSECVFEYAQCQECREKIVEELSDESKQTMQRFFEEKVNLTARRERLQGIEQHAPWMSCCAVCQAPVNQLQEYIIACLAIRHELIFDPFPMMICQACENQLQTSLSQATRDRWKRFISENFPGPPAEVISPDRTPVLF